MAWSGKIRAPFAERLIGRDEHGAPLVARGDQLEQHAGLGLILGDVGDVVEDEQIVAVELGDRGFERQFASRRLQALDEIGGTGEQDAPAVLDKGEPDRRTQGGSCRRQAGQTAASWPRC